MDGFPPHQYPSLCLLLSLSTKIFDADDMKHITPEDYVKNLKDVFSTIDDSWIEHCCSNLKVSATTRTECSQRLVLLSSLHTLFEHSKQGNSLLDSVVNKEQESSSSSPSLDFDKDVTDLRASSVHLSSDKVIMKSDQNCDCNQEIKDGWEKCEDAFKWYKKTAALLLEEDVIIEFMLQLFQSACTFTQHLAKKVIISYVTCSQSKITIILQHAESMLSHDFDSNLKMFDLLKEVMSICDLQHKSAVNRETFEWFMNHFESKYLLSFSKVMSSGTKCKMDENSNIISFLSFLKKIIKYGNYHRDVVKPFYLPLLTDFLINDSNKNMFRGGNIYQPVIVKIVKILNLALNLDIVLEKDAVATSITELAVQIVKNFPDLFFSLSKNYLSMNKSFWGTVNSDAMRTDKNIHSIFINYSIARQFLVLACKSCLFSSLSEPFDDVNIKGCMYQTYEIFKTWFLEEQKNCVNESEWFPALLGEEDDQWITVLLCLLLIYMHSKKKQENLQSSSRDMNASLSVEPDSTSRQEHQCYRTQDSSSPSSHVEQTKQSCFYDPLSPHKLFLQFANFIAFDHLVIADFLLSPETYFLAYFTKYISLLNDEWKVFYKSYHMEETVSYEKNVTNESISSNLHLNDDSSNTTLDNIKSECYLPIHESSTYNFRPSVSSKHLKNHQIFSSGSDGKSDTAIELAEKRKRFKSTSETGPTVMNSSDVTVMESGKRKLTDISSLVSYTDSENSENEISDNDEINFDKLGNASSEVPDTKKRKDGDMSENKTAKYYLTIPADNTFQGHSSLDYASSSHYNFSNDVESEQDSFEDVEEGYEPKSNLIDQFMTMLIRLQLHIDRLNEHSLIAYNVNPLLHLLNSCIEKYECGEPRTSK